MNVRSTTKQRETEARDKQRGKKIQTERSQRNKGWTGETTREERKGMDDCSQNCRKKKPALAIRPT